ncbi:hypothetical protein [Mycobacterium sp. Aquia_213]|uniref:hypothetical protein n=1 Tax=Mycobacterium sp. Aquia_213 TaxID=2991728 RepID=UPI00226F495F|nr:hypothetical protein [Mycobacterium sp. Aquia_213]WAC91893.1 hypothetical protein LMQ14_01310 [Mycobacterium sp. Aquia_213]
MTVIKRQMTVMALRLIPAAVIGALLALAQAPAAGADPPPPVPPAPFLPNTGFIPGAYGYLYGVYVTPPPATVDARGVKASAFGDPDAQEFGMPGSKLGNSPPVAGFFTGASAQYYITAGQTVLPPVVKGPYAMALSPGTPPENPDGIPPEKRPGPESIQPGPQSVVVPPVLETPGGRPFGAGGGGGAGAG